MIARQPPVVLLLGLECLCRDPSVLHKMQWRADFQVDESIVCGVFAYRRAKHRIEVLFPRMGLLGPLSPCDTAQIERAFLRIIRAAERLS